MTPEREQEILAMVALGVGEPWRSVVVELLDERDKVQLYVRFERDILDDRDRALGERDAAVARAERAEAQLAALREAVRDVLAEAAVIGGRERAQFAALYDAAASYSNLPSPGEIARLVREHREMVLRCGEAADYMAADDREIAKLAAQLAALRKAAGPHAASEYASDAETRVLRIVLADAAPAAEAYTRRVRAEALRGVADRWRKEWPLSECAIPESWLRVHADEIERGER